MAKPKGPGPRKPPAEKKPEKRPAKPLQKAVPPPDNPLLRFEQAGDPGLDSRAMAAKRLEAVKRTRAMPTSDEDC